MNADVIEGVLNGWLCENTSFQNWLHIKVKHIIFVYMNIINISMYQGTDYYSTKSLSPYFGETLPLGNQISLT